MSDNDKDLMEQLVEHLKCMPAKSGYRPLARVTENGSGFIYYREPIAVQRWSSVEGLRKFLAGSRLHNAEQRVIDLASRYFFASGTKRSDCPYGDCQDACDALRKLRAKNG